MSENNGRTVRNVEEITTGVVKVKVESQRGNGTDDRDSAEAYAYYDSIEEAEQNVGRIAQVLSKELRIARSMDENGIIESMSDAIGEDEESVVEDSEEELGDFKVESEQ